MEIDSLKSLLLDSLKTNNKFDWNTLKDFSNFEIAKPELSIVKMPNRDDFKYQPNFTLIDKMFLSQKQDKINEANKRYLYDLTAYQHTLSKNKKAYNDALNEADRRYLFDLTAYQHAVSNNKKVYNDSLKEWEEKRDEFIKKQEEHNSKIDKFKQDYFDNISSAISEYCEIILSNSNYPEFITKEYKVFYVEDSGILIVDYFLPAPNILPNVKGVKYNKSSKEYKVICLSETEQQKLYDNTIYQIALRTIHELYNADIINALKSVAFNGLVKHIDKGIGKEVTACIISLQANKEIFSEINLSQVDPKMCFKKLKGVGSSNLTGLTPVAPIIKINREDDRFIDAYNVTDDINSETYLAEMDWKDFEHLIRELFEEEFKVNGGEVKITQSSHDRGVDAIAFDPDPIRGGKIVIQSKRYTNVVGVSSVRDLYGTVMNEGATKGIIVTTSHYGPDAYEFAKGKPLTLLDGSNLLYLLQKHGHKAKIDIKEAKKNYIDRGL
ncbi:MAG: restriction endonuclease [Nitrospirae bacterium]|nr:restriction endonuclease [Nitrospirota bacterium]MBF0617067.1 restriction endonuclease [Nitrospirota bacterium]